MCEDYNRIKSYLYSHNWTLSSDEFYGLIKNCKATIGYKLNFDKESDTHYSIHFWMDNTDLYGDIWLRKYNK